jgi:hypothetical protein
MQVPFPELALAAANDHGGADDTLLHANRLAPGSGATD